MKGLEREMRQGLERKGSCRAEGSHRQADLAGHPRAGVVWEGRGDAQSTEPGACRAHPGKCREGLRRQERGGGEALV